MASLRMSAVLCLGVCGVSAAEQGHLAQITTGGASPAADLARETMLPRRLRGEQKQFPPHWSRLGGLAADEGKQLGDVAFLAHPAECMARCDPHADCNSVTYCPKWGGCFLKDRVFAGTEAISSGSDCLTYYKIKDTTPAPTKKSCGKWGSTYHPETEQCCGEDEATPRLTVNHPTVCSKDLGCCAGGFWGHSECFDHGSQQCCGQNHLAETHAVVCSLDVACPPKSYSSWRECPAAVAAVAAANSSSNDEMSNQMLFP